MLGVSRIDNEQGRNDRIPQDIHSMRERDKEKAGPALRDGIKN